MCLRKDLNNVTFNGIFGVILGLNTVTVTWNKQAPSSGTIIIEVGVSLCVLMTDAESPCSQFLSVRILATELQERSQHTNYSHNPSTSLAIHGYDVTRK